MLVGNAKFWTHGALRQPKGTVIARYLNILFPFFISGILHTILDVCGGVPAAETGAYMFFVLQAFAIMFEDGVEELYRRLGFTRMTKDSGPAQGGERQFNGTKPFLWQKLIGYGWVALFMVWTTPGWSYANIRNADPTVNYLLPFSLVTWARGQQTA